MANLSHSGHLQTCFSVHRKCKTGKKRAAFKVSTLSQYGNPGTEGLETSVKR